MMFVLKKDKIIIADLGDRFEARTWVEAGTYPIIRIFDDNRVLVNISKIGRKPRIITLLNIDSGEIYEPDE